MTGITATGLGTVAAEAVARGVKVDRAWPWRGRAATLVGRSALLAGALLLAGCAGTEDAADAPRGTAARTAERTVEREVEAPDVFQVTAQGLWDGRPSLGGVWVAHPDVGQPDKVIVRNTANGQSVTAALFRRERNNPGPPIQVSSEAAASLGILAGAPAPLSVTALRQVVQEVAAPAEQMPAGTTDSAPPVRPDAAAASAQAAARPAAIAESALEPAAPPAVAAATTATQATPLAAPYVQLGIYNREENAQSAADRMRAEGIEPQVVARDRSGNRSWRVIVGPVATAAERAALLETAKAKGFTDAYFVTG